MFNYNSTGVSMDSGPTAPDGDYWVKIVEASDEKDGSPRISKNGDPIVNVRCEIDEGEFLGTTFFHNVTFMPVNKKGAGMAVHFLKTIGEPWEGDVAVEPSAWTGKRFRAHLRVEKDLKGRPRNQIAYLLDDPKAEDEVPF